MGFKRVLNSLTQQSVNTLNPKSTLEHGSSIKVVRKRAMTSEWLVLEKKGWKKPFSQYHHRQLISKPETHHLFHSYRWALLRIHVTAYVDVLSSLFHFCFRLMYWVLSCFTRVVEKSIILVKVIMRLAKWPSTPVLIRPKRAIGGGKSVTIK